MKLFFSFLFFSIFLKPVFAHLEEENRRAIDSLTEIVNRVNGNDTDALNAYIQLAHLHFAYHPDSAFGYLEEATERSYQSELKYFLAPIHIKRGTFFLKQGNHLKALRDLYTGIIYYEKYRDLLFITGYPYISMGNLFYDIEYYSKAIECYNTSLDYFEGDSYEMIYGQAVAYNNIGLCHIKNENLHLALDYFLKGLEKRKKILTQGLKRYDLILHSNIYLAEVYNKLNQFEKADSILQLSETLLDSTNDVEWHKNLFLNWANLLMRTGEYDKARHYLQKSLMVYKVSLNNFLDIDILKTYVELEILDGKYDRAIDYAKDGLQLARKNGSIDAEIDFYNYLKDIYLQLGNQSRAYECSEKITELQKEFFNNQKEMFAELMAINLNLSIEKEKNLSLEQISNQQRVKISEQENYILMASFAIILLMLIILWVTTLYGRIKKAEKKLRIINERTSSLVNNTDSIFLSVGQSGKIRLFNNAGQKLFEDFFGRKLDFKKTVQENIREETIKKAYLAILEKTKTEKSWQQTIELNINGTNRYLLTTFTSIKGDKGEPRGFVAFATDFTTENEQKVKLEEQKLFLKKANTSREKMMSLLAHDLKDSIYSAKNLTDVIKMDPDSFEKDDLLKFFGILGNSFTKTKNLLEDLLEWAKAQSNSLNASMEPQQLGTIVNGIVENFNTRLKEKNIDIKNEIPEELIVLADSYMLRTIFRNLITNAIKFTYANTGEITIKADINPDNTATIHVIDNGKGISPDIIGRIFTAHEKITIPGTEQEQGTGFGLSLVKEFLELQNSSIEVDSEEGKGSDFFFKLKLADQ